MAPLRIAVLECDTPVDKINAKYDGYWGVFSSLLRASAKALDQPDRLNPETGLDITRWDVVTAQEYPKLEDVDALLLTGSKHNSFDNDPWILKLVEYTKSALQDPRIKLLGICFGHQIIGRALDVKVGRSDAGWEIAVCDMDLTDQGKKLFGRDKLRIQQMHQDIVFEYPANVVPLGSSPRCAVQGMYLPGRFVTVQGHPEFNEEIVTEVVTLRGKAGVFSKEQTEDALERAKNEHDGVAIGSVFLNFLLEE
ncbi:class I glutamine amidotransferase-like protein [Aspergillus steynii IBT 23096]|uniref:Class I glutamine amidotransferase-like protein n=1 Tax=Aspergillus steynii IBT 23096 TaxID=1392250 RepID=A0A2I2G2U7_9EURO|nr:class I glutamine amidotransferase-like protein [Aspergillus steynii IBT 23096]PLB47196.1 class I glutamine amidotransferase-like protein [Aspergillus steynii IBT 23096]